MVAGVCWPPLVWIWLVLFEHSHMPLVRGPAHTCATTFSSLFVLLQMTKINWAVQEIGRNNGGPSFKMICLIFLRDKNLTFGQGCRFFFNTVNVTWSGLIHVSSTFWVNILPETHVPPPSHLWLGWSVLVVRKHMLDNPLTFNIRKVYLLDSPLAASLCRNAY